MTTSQKAADAPMTWRLESPGNAVVSLTMPVRPEELTYDEPALQTVVPTLDGAFLDDFGRATPGIQLSGHTGWGQGTRPDGAQQFYALHSLVWTAWHDYREQAIAKGLDPDQVRLIFVDTLNQSVSLVAPGRFVMKRSRSRPLLFQFQISMTVLNGSLAVPQSDKLSIANSATPGGVLAGLKSLANTISNVANATTQLAANIDATIATPAQAFMGLTLSALNAVTRQVDGVNGTVSPSAGQIVSIAGDLCDAARNVFRAYTAVTSLSLDAQVFFSSLASNYSDAFCVLRNALRTAEVYPDYSGLYGSSNCSSTIGGSPLSAYAGMNPWSVIAPTVSSVAAITPNARQNIDVLRQSDPVLLPMPISELGSRMGAIAAGVQVLS
ncbi:MAG TPA: hypothetical protein VJP88_04555 [Caulobacteraceae bacterium]|nr:hypothetical protein [Caulobacteraceae bacterium]